jgi:hypothetical protein
MAVRSEAVCVLVGCRIGHRHSAGAVGPRLLRGTLLRSRPRLPTDRWCEVRRRVAKKVMSRVEDCGCRKQLKVRNRRGTVAVAAARLGWYWDGLCEDSPSTRRSRRAVR